jgi:hypothetical protein
VADNKCFKSLKRISFGPLLESELFRGCRPSHLTLETDDMDFDIAGDALASSTTVKIDFDMLRASGKERRVIKLLATNWGAVTKAKFTFQNDDDCGKYFVRVISALGPKMIPLKHLCLYCGLQSTVHIFLEAITIASPHLSVLDLQWIGEFSTNVSLSVLRSLTELEELILPDFCPDIRQLRSQLELSTSDTGMDALIAAFVSILPPKLRSLRGVFVRGEYACVPILSFLYSMSESKRATAFCLNEMIRRGLLDAHSSKSCTALSFCILNGSEIKVLELLNAGASPFVRCSVKAAIEPTIQVTPFHVAVWEGSLSMLETLLKFVDLKQIADLQSKMRCHDGYTPLHFVCPSISTWKAMYEALIPLWPTIIYDANNMSCENVLQRTVGAEGMAEFLLERYPDLIEAAYKYPSEESLFSAYMRQWCSGKGPQRAKLEEMRPLLDRLFHAHLRFLKTEPTSLKDYGFPIDEETEMATCLALAFNGFPADSDWFHFGSILIRQATLKDAKKACGLTFRRNWTPDPPRNLKHTDLVLRCFIASFPEKSIRGRILKGIISSCNPMLMRSDDNTPEAWDDFWLMFWNAAADQHISRFLSDLDMKKPSKMVLNSRVAHLVKLAEFFESGDKIIPFVHIGTIASAMASQVLSISKSCGSTAQHVVVSAGQMLLRDLWRALSRVPHLDRESKSLIKLNLQDAEQSAAYLLSKYPTVAASVTQCVRLEDIRTLFDGLDLTA